MLVGVPVDAAEQVATATVEPWKQRGGGGQSVKDMSEGSELSRLCWSATPKE